MAEHDPPPPVTEPVIVPDTYATGIDVETVDGNVRLTAWVDVSDERRVAARLVLTDAAARTLIKDMRKALGKGSH